MSVDEQQPSPEARYAALCGVLFSRGEVNPSEMKGFGSSALVVEGRIFAMLARGRLVVKLPKARVDALVEAGWGARFDANRGRPMKQWLTIDPARRDDWLALAEEALDLARAERRAKQ